MTNPLPASTIAEKALQRIGAFSINDTAAQKVEIDRALEWLDVVIDSLLEKYTPPWMTQRDYLLPLTIGKASYLLPDDFVHLLPVDGVQYPKSASLIVGTAPTGRGNTMTLVRRSAWELAINDPQIGDPSIIYVDRLEPSTMYLHPTPARDAVLRLTASTYALDPSDEQGRVLTQLPRAWNRWAIMALAAEIGAGPVRKLPEVEIVRLARYAEDLKRQLVAVHSREHASTGFTRPWGI
ncbi:MAG: hypothetical protein IPK75_18975 [Acidobacteria bacterium]|nr:hypothetical protein [Acidobacteriota bacterium]